VCRCLFAKKYRTSYALSEPVCRGWRFRRAEKRDICFAGVHHLTPNTCTMRDTTGATSGINRPLQQSGPFCDISSVKQADVAPISCNDRPFAFIWHRLADQFGSIFVFVVFRFSFSLHYDRCGIENFHIHTHTVVIFELYSCLELHEVGI